MSRIGQMPIVIPSGVDVKMDGVVLSAKGPQGALSLAISDGFKVQIDQGILSLSQTRSEKKLGALHGLYRSLIANMIHGVSKGYVKDLEIQGVGFKASVQGNKIVFALGFSRPVEMNIPIGIDVKVNDNVKVIVSGPDKQQVGNLAATIKALFPAEPYKGKGIRFKGEYVRRKAGKTVA